MKNAYKLYSENLKGRNRLEGVDRKWEDNIKIYICKVQDESTDWIHLAQDRDI
jgi:hypothetical protein